MFVRFGKFVMETPLRSAPLAMSSPSIACAVAVIANILALLKASQQIYFLVVRAALQNEGCTRWQRVIPCEACVACKPMHEACAQ